MSGLQNVCKKKKHNTHILIMIWLLVLIVLTGTVNLLTAHATESGAAEAGAGGMEDTAADVDDQKMNEMISWLTEQMEVGAMTTESDIRAAISLGEEKLGIRIPDGMTNALVTVIEKMQTLGLDSDFLIEQVAKLWQEYGDDIAGEGSKGFWATIWAAIKDFFVSVWNFIVDFITGLVKLIFK